jgi:hypothetical protein
MAEFVANHQTAASTGVTPFLANKGYHPRMKFNIPRTPRAPQELDAKKVVERMKKLVEHLTVQMSAAQDRYKTATSKSRTSPHDFQVGKLVFLSAKDLHTT